MDRSMKVGHRHDERSVKGLTWPLESDSPGFKPRFPSTSLSLSFLISKAGGNK